MITASTSYFKVITNYHKGDWAGLHNPNSI